MKVLQVKSEILSAVQYEFDNLQTIDDVKILFQCIEKKEIDTNENRFALMTTIFKEPNKLGNTYTKVTEQNKDYLFRKTILNIIFA